MEATQIILIVFIVLLIILYPILMYSRNKKENLRMQEQTNSLKNGDKVLTTNGIYGTVVSIRDEYERTVVTLETGDETNKGYVAVDAYAIYKIFQDGEPTEQNSEVKADDKNEKTSVEENEQVDKTDNEKQNDEESLNQSPENSNDEVKETNVSSEDGDSDGTKSEE